MASHLVFRSCWSPFAFFAPQWGPSRSCRSFFWWFTSMLILFRYYPNNSCKLWRILWNSLEKTRKWKRPFITTFSTRARSSCSGLRTGLVSGNWCCLKALNWPLISILWERPPKLTAPMIVGMTRTVTRLNFRWSTLFSINDYWYPVLWL